MKTGDLGTEGIKHCVSKTKFMPSFKHLILSTLLLQYKLGQKEKKKR
jgi:hypothetical protein